MAEVGNFLLNKTDSTIAENMSQNIVFQPVKNY
jgi:hypothetical protein